MNTFGFIHTKLAGWLKCMSSFKWVEVTLYLHLSLFLFITFTPSPPELIYELLPSCSNTLLGM